MLKIMLWVPVLLLSACAQQPGKPLQIQRLEQLPALAAEFETIVDSDDGQQRYHWRFWRTSKRVETHNLQDNTGEIWTKSTDGKIAYERVFHDQKQVIEYTPGDLNAIGAVPDWSAIATLLNQSMIAGLVEDGREQVLGRPASHYQSNNADAPIEITWLDREQLPALIKRNDKGHTISTRIIGIYPLAESPGPYQRSTNYRYTDFADIGDKESDPFIQSIQHKIKGGHNHSD
ncbi:MAG: hypothetical protein Q8N35_12355 [Methylococcaceae bacterium]|nr:hypothetical protein [Methylococcaceae bacterium]MDZ4158050.1 hypothetical protein [Methylococcales bacterium]MDP2392841.1 hypothetical protein [Methylococcaceae bacterium]MDP3020369.1 hypothetical protein [Methylococcaceae bacterium]MDP3391976.1 hypothetical protein [Methylococcaceae bacterium]